MASGLYEPSETALIRNLLLDCDVFINVGANIGYYCCHALSLNKPVIAFEPLKENLYFLRRNIKINKWETMIKIFPIAAAEKKGKLIMYGGNTGASLIKGWAGLPDFWQTKVNTDTLDHILGNSLSGKKILILIDAEGSETKILSGCSLLLKQKPRPTWIVEIVDVENQPKIGSVNPDLLSSFSFFYKNKYSINYISKTNSKVSWKKVKSVACGKEKFKAYNFIFK